MGFRDTLTSGIQDISAFLPILGTEQCEAHVGAALRGGYLYAAATPLSMFGCLGIVKAALTIMFASIDSNCFHGAQTLKDAGFELQGSAAAMIGAVEQSRPDGRANYVAKAEFMKLFEEQNMRDMVLKVNYECARWNFSLVGFTALLSLLSFVPYIPILYAQRFELNAEIWLYPTLRIAGSAICVVAAQIVLQIRIRQILRTIGDDDANDTSTIEKDDDDPSGSEYMLALFLSRVGLVVGSILTSAGYIGCFTIVQNSLSKDALLWLILEGLLSLLRVWVWGFNPGWDECAKIIFTPNLQTPGATSVHRLPYPSSEPAGVISRATSVHSRPGTSSEPAGVINRATSIHRRPDTPSEPAGVINRATSVHRRPNTSSEPAGVINRATSVHCRPDPSSEPAGVISRATSVHSRPDTSSGPAGMIDPATSTPRLQDSFEYADVISLSTFVNQAFACYLDSDFLYDNAAFVGCFKPFRDENHPTAIFYALKEFRTDPMILFTTVRDLKTGAAFVLVHSTALPSPSSLNTRTPPIVHSALRSSSSLNTSTPQSVHSALRSPSNLDTSIHTTVHSAKVRVSDDTGYAETIIGAKLLMARHTLLNTERFRNIYRHSQELINLFNDSERRGGVVTFHAYWNADRFRGQPPEGL